MLLHVNTDMYELTVNNLMIMLIRFFLSCNFADDSWREVYEPIAQVRRAEHVRVCMTKYDCK